MRTKLLGVGLSVLVVAGWMTHAAGQTTDGRNMLVGQAAFIDYRSIKPGTFRKIPTADLPKAHATESAGTRP